MRNLSKTLISSLFLSLALPERVVGQGPLWRVDDLQSSILRERRKLFVATPEMSFQRAGRPVLIVLDADDETQFSAAVANVAFLTNRLAIPPLLVIGVPNTRDRTHDLTPPATGVTAENAPTAGGAEAFGRFLTDEVLPFLRRRYGAGQSAVLMGHSFGALFALHFAARHPGTFAGTIAASPSLWWNDTTVAREYAAALAASRAPQRVFLSAGEFERQIGNATTRFTAAFDSAAHDSLVVVQFARYPNETHGLTPQRSLIDGLRFVFAPISTANLPTARLGPGVDSVTVVEAVRNAQTQYARAARVLALPEALPVELLNRLAPNVLSVLKRPGLAAWVYEQNARMHPADPSVYDGWADALTALGDTAQARLKREQASRLRRPSRAPRAP